MSDSDQLLADKQRKRAILASFDPDLFVDHTSWRHLFSLLEDEGGGSYGLAGPRGAGKTWMMLNARAWAKKQEGLGVWFPSPSEYEASAFLSALSDVLATAYEEWYDQSTGRASRLVRQRAYAMLVGGSVLAYAGAIVIYFVYLQSGRFYARHVPLFYLTNVITFLVILSPVVAGIWLMVKSWRYMRASRDFAKRLRGRAEELRREVRFAATTKESSETGADASRWGFAARFKRASERQLVERPATLSSLIHNFRSFAEQAGEVTKKLIVCIDELDKMSDAAKVAELLRDIKGIFEIPKVVFLVSISDEAARSLELGSIRTRNEFSSSFYTVIRVGNLSADKATEILTRRTENFGPDVARVAGILSGGLAREIVRNADLASGNGSCDMPTAALEIAAGELSAFKLDLLETCSINGQDEIHYLEHDKLVIDRIAPSEECVRLHKDPNFSLFIEHGLRYWTISNASQQWKQDFEEQWRRLLVRLAVAGVIARKASTLNSDDFQLLQSIVTTASQSSLIARVQFFEYSLRPIELHIPADLPEPQLYLLTEVVTDPDLILTRRVSFPAWMESRHNLAYHANALVRLGAFQSYNHGLSRRWTLVTR